MLITGGMLIVASVVLGYLSRQYSNALRSTTTKNVLLKTKDLQIETLCRVMELTEADDMLVADLFRLEGSEEFAEAVVGRIDCNKVYRRVLCETDCRKFGHIEPDMIHQACKPNKLVLLARKIVDCCQAKPGGPTSTRTPSKDHTLTL